MFLTLVFLPVFTYKPLLKLSNQIYLLFQNICVPNKCAAHGEWQFQLECGQTLFDALHHHGVDLVVNPAPVQLGDQFLPEFVAVHSPVLI